MRMNNILHIIDSLIIHFNSFRSLSLHSNSKEKINIVECNIGADKNELEAINASLQDCYLKVYSQKGNFFAF